MPNKPISYLIIKGYNNDKSDIITTPSGGNDFFVDDSYLQLSGITLNLGEDFYCLLYTSPSPRDRQKSRMPSSA